MKSFPVLLDAMIERLNADGGRIEMSLLYFLMKKSPVSDVESLMDYRASLVCERRDTRTDTWIKGVVSATSLCPCSKEISDYGAHNQRSHLTLTAKIREHMWIEDLIDIAEERRYPLRQ